MIFIETMFDSYRYVCRCVRFISQEIVHVIPACDVSRGTYQCRLLRSVFVNVFPSCVYMA